MLARRLLLLSTGGGGANASPTLPTNYTMLYNGQSGNAVVKIGRATSADGGTTWTRYTSNPVMSPANPVSWYDHQIHAPCLLWDGSQWVAYFDGYDGTNYRIGRATSADSIAWTMEATNPILGLGTAGAFDDTGAQSPQVVYDATLTPHWKMWYVGNHSGTTTVGFADSTDGISWTKRGKIIDVATGFTDSGVGLGCAIRASSTWYVYIAGFHGGFYRAGYTTVAVGSEATSAAYAAAAQITAFSGTITTLTSDSPGYTYQSNALTSVLARGSSYVGYGTAFAPTSLPPGVAQREVSLRTTSTDLVTWTTPTGVLLPLSSGTFDTVSAENPTVVAT